VAQRITDLYKLVTYPIVYKTMALVLGSDRAYERYLREILQVQPGMKMLDVGCGPATILSHLPSVDYTGIDLNESHVESARSQYPGKGRFLVGNAGVDLRLEKGEFDLINVSALLHHLSDEECRSLFSGLKQLMKPNGRIVTLDNVWLPRQRALVRFVNSMDSGLNIRTPEQYLSLLDGHSFEVETRTFNDLLRIPYDHFVMIARNSAPPNN
jgi:SAM-dependent methyltransferase